MVCRVEACSRVSQHDPARTRIWNLRFRRPIPYPLGHRTNETFQTLHLLKLTNLACGADTKWHMQCTWWTISSQLMYLGLIRLSLWNPAGCSGQVSSLQSEVPKTTALFIGPRGRRENASYSMNLLPSSCQRYLWKAIATANYSLCKTILLGENETHFWLWMKRSQRQGCAECSLSVEEGTKG